MLYFIPRVYIYNILIILLNAISDDSNVKCLKLVVVPYKKYKLYYILIYITKTVKLFSK